MRTLLLAGQFRGVASAAPSSLHVIFPDVFSRRFPDPNSFTRFLSERAGGEAGWAGDCREEEKGMLDQDAAAASS